MFKQSIDSKRKEGVRIADQFLKKIDGLNMKGLRTCSAIVTQLGVRLLKYVLARAALDF
jgi:hypothetical protein